MRNVSLHSTPAAATNGKASTLPVSQPGLRAVSRVVDQVTTRKFELINATRRIDEAVRQSGVRNGIVHVQSLHTTTALFINEWQDALLDDFRILLERLVAWNIAWRHDDPRYSDCERHNATSHLQSLMLGQAVSLQVRSARLLLGAWQSIIFAELDGPRTRSLSIQVSGV